jgi:tape measure domain-containing protein
MDELAKLTIRVDDRDAPRVVRNLGDITKATKRAEDGAAQMASSIKSMLGGLAAALSVRELVNYSDAATNLANRLRLVTTSESDRIKTSRELFEVSRRTRSDVTATAELYVKLRQSNESLNYTTQQTRDLTEAFALSLKASGADAATSAGAIRQFAQAMAAGAIRGDEFVTISEAAPVVLQLMQKELGKSSAELRKMKEDGELTAGVIGGVLLKNLDALRTQAAGSTMSIADGFTALRNSVIKTIGASNDLATAASNIANGLADAGKFLEDNGPVLGQLVKFAAVAWGAQRAVTALSASVAALNGMSVAALATRLGPLIAVLAPFSGFIAKGMRDASDTQDRASEVQRIAALPSGERDTLAAGVAQSRTAVETRRIEIARKQAEMYDQALQAEDALLNKRLQQLKAQQEIIRDAGGYAVAAVAGTGGGTSAGIVGGAVSKAKTETERMLADLAQAGQDLVNGIARSFDEMALRLDTFVQSPLNGGLRRSAITGPDAQGGISDMVARSRGFDPDAITQTAERASAVTQALADGLQRSIAQGIAGGFTDGTRSLQAFADNMKRTLINALSEGLANRLVGGLMGGGSGGGGLLGSLGGLLGGGDKTAGIAKNAGAGFGGLGLAGVGLGLFAGSQILNLFKPDRNQGYGTFAPGQSITPAAEVVRAGTYSAPGGFNAGAYRFEAGRPSGTAVTGNTIVVTLPEGTPREMAQAMLAEFERIARAQGLPAGTLPLSDGV